MDKPELERQSSPSKGPTTLEWAEQGKGRGSRVDVGTNHRAELVNSKMPIKK